MAYVEIDDIMTDAGQPGKQELFKQIKDNFIDHETRLAALELTSLGNPIGTIIKFPIASPPTGYLECNFQEVSRTTYANLYSLIGDSFGNGNGTTTFNLPDHRGRTAIGVGTGVANYLGDTNSALTARAEFTAGGRETHTLAEVNVPTHTHSFSATTSTQSADHRHGITTSTDGVGGATNAYLRGTYANTSNIFDQVTVQEFSHTHTLSGTTGTGSGSATAVAQMNPWIAMYFMIKY